MNFEGFEFDSPLNVQQATSKVAVELELQYWD